MWYFVGHNAVNDVSSSAGAEAANCKACCVLACPSSHQPLGTCSGLAHVGTQRQAARLLHQSCKPLRGALASCCLQQDVILQWHLYAWRSCPDLIACKVEAKVCGVGCSENRRIHVVNCQWLYDTVRFWEVKDPGEVSACRQLCPPRSTPAPQLDTRPAQLGLLSRVLQPVPASCWGLVPACIKVPGSTF